MGIFIQILSIGCSTLRLVTLKKKKSYQYGINCSLPCIAVAAGEIKTVNNMEKTLFLQKHG